MRVERAKDAADHADRESPAWTEAAVEAVRVYARLGGPFLIEDVRIAIESQGYFPAPDERAWGHVARECQRRGLIRRVGYRQAHDGSPKTLWAVA